jgi:hypothetical protein
MGAPLCWVEQPQLLSWRASRADFEQANAKKKFARQVAREFFDTRTQPDWREEAEARMPEALPLAVNAGEVYEPSDTEENSRASITAITRFDRKPADAPGKSSGLRLVNEEKAEEVAPWESVTFEQAEEEDEYKPWEDL